MTINTGIDQAKRAELARSITGFLADTYALYLKTQGFHWNVTGLHFQALHELFGTQYTELAMAIDEIAERVRALGVYAPGSLSAMRELSSLEEASGKLSDRQMLGALLSDHESLARSARSLLHGAADAGDDATADLMNQRLNLHEKTAWMLRAHLDG
ncbi:MAG: DNA starvation/stationary phase protection protein [Myxococcales bacterium]|nr:DNA starvation/stationary phase protection protein [Myxococcales bacterium]